MTNIAIQAQNLTRFFGNKLVVDHATFELPSGTVTGLLGLNGAGKSTLIKMLLGLLVPTRGSSTILGVESQSLAAADRAKIGYTIEGHFLYHSLTVRESELLQADSFSNWDAGAFQATLDRFRIRPRDRIRTLSRGQRAGVSIALTLSTQPEMLILDDPALGLDPVARRTLNETILAYMENGQRTVLLSSQLLDDIERVADHVLIMVEGRIVVSSSVDGFLSRVSTWTCDSPDDRGQLPHIPGLIHARTQGNRLTMSVVDADAETEAAMSRIGGESLERTESSFDNNVIAYLSRQGSSNCFS